MAKTLFDIGPAPHAEPCATVGESGYRDRATRECQAFANQLRRQFGQEPTGAKIQVKSNQHQLGIYLEVVFLYDDLDLTHTTYLRRIEAEASPRWDQLARIELGIADG